MEQMSYEEKYHRLCEVISYYREHCMIHRYASAYKILNDLKEYILEIERFNNEGY